MGKGKKRKKSKMDSCFRSGRVDFRGKIINLALDMFILTWISSAKRSRFQTITGKKDETKATDLGVL